MLSLKNTSGTCPVGILLLFSMLGSMKVSSLTDEQVANFLSKCLENNEISNYLVRTYHPYILDLIRNGQTKSIKPIEEAWKLFSTNQNGELFYFVLRSFKAYQEEGASEETVKLRRNLQSEIDKEFQRLIKSTTDVDLILLIRDILQLNPSEGLITILKNLFKGAVNETFATPYSRPQPETLQRNIILTLQKIDTTDAKKALEELSNEAGYEEEAEWLASRVNDIDRL